jgi:hypothetical protein
MNRAEGDGYLSLKEPRSGLETGFPSRDSVTKPLRRGVRDARYHPARAHACQLVARFGRASCRAGKPAPGKDDAGEHIVLRPICCHSFVFSAMYCSGPPRLRQQQL